MRTLYIDCGMGAAGDMLTAALLELLPEPEPFLSRFNRLSIPGVAMACEKVSKCGIMGTHVSISVNGTEEHSRDIPAGEGAVEQECGHGQGQDCQSDHDHRHEHTCEQDGRNECAHVHEYVHPHEHAGQSEHAHSHPHIHMDMPGLRRLVDSLDLPNEVKGDIQAVYGRIAEAESSVHGVPVEQVHFHEVGAMDAVADVAAVCLLMHELAPEQVIVSHVNVGRGHVRCAHGILPVPAPATLQLLKQVPIYSNFVEGELCTPTGAALLTHFAARFGTMPVMQVEKAGYGMGSKDFEAANCVRVLLGKSNG